MTNDRIDRRPVRRTSLKVVRVPRRISRLRVVVQLRVSSKREDQRRNMPVQSAIVRTRSLPRCGGISITNAVSSRNSFAQFARSNLLRRVTWIVTCEPNIRHHTLFILFSFFIFDRLTRRTIPFLGKVVCEDQRRKVHRFHSGVSRPFHILIIFLMSFLMFILDIFLYIINISMPVSLRMCAFQRESSIRCMYLKDAILLGAKSLGIFIKKEKRKNQIP